MGSKNWAVLVALLLTLPLATALSSIYESTTVSRIVGGTPEEMERQLRGGDLDLQDAAYQDSGYMLRPDGSHVLESSFPAFERFPDTDWIQQSNEKLLIYDAAGDGTPSENSFTDTAEARNWQTALDSSLAVMSSEYAGLALPGLDSFANTLAPHTHLIAPLSHQSTPFTDALICNLGDGTLAEAFRKARNNYHWNLDNKHELVGLTLLSYALYGDPFATVTVPQFDTNTRDDLCKNLQEDFTIQQTSSFHITATSHGYKKTIRFHIPDHALEQVQGYDLITTSATEQNIFPGELILPTRTLATEFPRKTVFTGVELTGFSDPVSITANVPDYDGTQAVPRTCPQNTAQPEITFTNAHLEEKEAVIASIKPVEIVDCANGQFKLYKTVEYEIEYVPYSPIHLTSINAPAHATPDKLHTVTVHTENTQDQPVTGTLALKDSTGNTLAANDISTTKSTHELELLTPNEEGTRTYTVEFLQNGQEKTKATFTTDVRILSANLATSYENQQATVTLTLQNNWAQDITTTITTHLIRDGQPEQQQQKSTTLSPGTNTVTFTFDNLNNGPYQVHASIPYLNTAKTLTGTILTNHAPSILTGNPVAKEGDTITLDPEIVDADGDAITSSIDAPFPVDGTHTLGYEDSGEYDIIIEASDGSKTTTKTITLTVENVNRAPSITVEHATVKEGETLTLSPKVSDPDNQNSVNNDDNNLTISYWHPFDQNGQYTPDYDSSGQILTWTSVTDGEHTETVPVTVTVENTNRAPETEDIFHMFIKEGQTIDLKQAIDPDNLNLDTSDDNELTYAFEAPIPDNGVWTPTHNDNGQYTTTITISDGENTVEKDITLVVTNVNRPPTIELEEQYVFTEGDLVKITPTVTDPDNENSNAEDDNTLSITYGSPLDHNGEWQTGKGYKSYITLPITVSDGEYQDKATATLIIKAVGEPEPQPDDSESAPAQEPTAEKTPEPEEPEDEPEQEPELDLAITAAGKQMKDGDTIELAPGTTFTVTLDLTNTGPQKRTDLDLAFMDQYKEDSIVLRNGQHKRMEYTLTIPAITDDNHYELEIDIWHGSKHHQTDLNIAIDKPKHRIALTNLKTSSPACGKARTAFTVQNTGASDEDVTLTLQSGSIHRTHAFGLFQGEERDISVTLNLPPGEQNLAITAAYSGEETTATGSVAVC